ncbi:DUF3800 domain-containing protein [Streptomyces sp. XD-27]|uniref:DUF3800 domain-containing protein n=1 Tax=Streptomyces sp. XD-27 TaxID=3062779 RepID=UPI0026F47CAB|nr:DUF3800 domain-containing protein [Streptomyces sp. XD-27]WKX69248.1 DUF3800 domain-containing protein [Streptomyces sp. XD-27]
MLLTYVDESYDNDRYWMVALLVAERHLRPLHHALDSVVAKAADSYPVDRHAELHGHALVQAKDDWQRMGNKGGNMIRARIGVYGDAMKAIGSHDVQVIVRGIDVRAYRSQQADAGSCPPPHQVVLRQLLEQICDHVQVRDELALVIADEIDGADDHRRHFRDYQTAGTGGSISSTLPRLVDTIHFAPSKASRLLQAADLIAYLHRRLVSGQDGDPRARRANETLWSFVAPRVIHQHCWVPAPPRA